MKSYDDKVYLKWAKIALFKVKSIHLQVKASNRSRSSGMSYEVCFEMFRVTVRKFSEVPLLYFNIHYKPRAIKQGEYIELLSWM